MPKKLKLELKFQIDKIKVTLPPHVLEWAKRISDSNDRSAVILAAAAAEDDLRTILAIALATNSKEIFEGPSAALGTFSSRITIGKHMGIIHPDVAAALNGVRKVRNAAAHRPEKFTLAGLDQKEMKNLKRFCRHCKTSPLFDSLIVSLNINSAKAKPSLRTDFVIGAAVTRAVLHSSLALWETIGKPVNKMLPPSLGYKEVNS